MSNTRDNKTVSEVSEIRKKIIQNLQKKGGCKKDLYHHKCSQKNKKLHCKSKIGIAIARRRGIKILNEEIDSKSNLKEVEKIGDLIETLKEDKNPVEKQKSIESVKSVEKKNPEDEKITRTVDSRDILKDPKNINGETKKNAKPSFESLLKENFEKERSQHDNQLKKSYYCCCKMKKLQDYSNHKKIERNSKTVNYGKGQYPHCINFPNVPVLVCLCSKSKKFSNDNEITDKNKRTSPINDCTCGNYKTHEKNIVYIVNTKECKFQVPVKTCSYCNLSIDICNCEDPMKKEDPKEECFCLERSSKSKPCGAEVLPYQRLNVFSNVMDELQQKISKSGFCHFCKKSPCRCCCCLHENYKEKEKES